MSNQQHTPEPWRFAWQNNNELQMSFACVVVGDNIIVIGHGVSSEANARRIVACVNACAGLDTKELEAYKAEHLSDGIKNIALTAELNAIKKQRDELLKFMHEIETVTPETKDLWIHTVKVKAGALLASAKGGAA